MRELPGNHEWRERRARRQDDVGPKVMQLTASRGEKRAPPEGDIVGIPEGCLVASIEPAEQFSPRTLTAGRCRRGVPITSLDRVRYAVQVATGHEANGFGADLDIQIGRKGLVCGCKHSDPVAGLRQILRRLHATDGSDVIEGRKMVSDK